MFEESGGSTATLGDSGGVTEDASEGEAGVRTFWTRERVAKEADTDGRQ